MELAHGINDDNQFIAGYRIGAQIGKGGFADVFLAENEVTGRTVALKRINRKHVRSSRLPNYEQRILKEVEIHQKLSKPGHPNVVKLYDSFKDADYVYVVMEYCPHRDMRHYLKEHGALDENLAARVLEQVARGVKYLHSQNVIHRDLSTGNVLISQQTATDLLVKIGDLGLSTQQKTPDQRHFTVCGTPNFISPEVALSKKGGAGHGKEADIWSLGAFLYAILNGKPPFGENQEASETLKRIIAGERGGTEAFSSMANHLIASMMNPNVNKRLTIDEVLCHPFLTSRERKAQFPGYTHMSSSSADSGRGSMRGNGFSGAIQHSSRSLDRNRNRRISPSPPVRGPFRVNRSPAGLPPVPCGRQFPRHVSEEDFGRRTRGEEFRREELIRSVRISPEVHSNCMHSQVNEERCCRRCGRRMSVLEESRRPPPLSGRCSSFRETGSCRGSCKGAVVKNLVPALEPQGLSGERSRHRSCSRERQGIQEPAQPSCSSVDSPNVKLLKPVCAERLKPQVEKSSKAMLRILDSSEVCVEFLRKSANGMEFVVEVMRISANGKKIVIYKPANDTVVNHSSPPEYSIENAEHYDSLDLLPEKHQKKYVYATKFVDLVRSKTPKITLYAEDSKSILKENGDFEMNFANGKCVVKKVVSRKAEASKFGQAVTLTDEEELDFQSKLSHCRSVEHALEALTGNRSPCFPVIIGRRLSCISSSANSTPRTPGSEIVRPRKAEENKENTPLLPVAARQPLSRTNADSKDKQDTKSRYISKFDCTAKMKSDGSYEITFHKSGEILYLGRSGTLVFKGKDGQERRYHMRDKNSLPSDIQDRLNSLEEIFLSLSTTPSLIR